MTDFSKPENQVTTHVFRRMKEQGEKITMLTAYDFPSARAVDRAGIDSILVGDSVGMVMLGYENTLPVTMEEILHHCRAVSRGSQRCLLIGDMPFLSYQTSPAEAVKNAGRFLKDGGMNAVKVEGGIERIAAVEAILGAGIPVLGHLGLTPQSIHQLGGFKTQGKTASAGKKLLEDALALQEAGCFGIVLESIPDRLAADISRKLTIPTIGIGAGRDCDGQVLVYHDLLGLFDDFQPRFVKQYARLSEIIAQALEHYQEEVSRKIFPAQEHTYQMSDQEWAEYQQLVEES